MSSHSLLNAADGSKRVETRVNASIALGGGTHRNAVVEPCDHIAGLYMRLETTAQHGVPLAGIRSVMDDRRSAVDPPLREPN